MSGLFKNEGVQQTEVRTLGRGSGRGQDVTIILIPKGGSGNRRLALIHLDSHALSTHSEYFNRCLSKRRDQQDPPSISEPVEFYLEVRRDVQHYFDCFSNMYSPFGKSFGSVEQSLELLKVASQIDFLGLMKRISLYLSSMLWTKEDEIRVREYSASLGFPRSHIKDLVVRLGLDEIEEDSQKQLLVLFNGVLEASSIPTVMASPAVLQAFRCAPPSEYSRRVVAMLNQAAMEVFFDIERDCDELLRTTSGYTNMDIDSFSMSNFDMIRAMCWILEALLKGQVAEELVQGIVHLDATPKYICHVSVEYAEAAMFSKRDFAELVLVMYKEVVARRLVLKPPERMALLVNWHAVLKSSLKVGTFEEATADLFLTLPLKQQAELIHLQKERVYDFISTNSLASVLHFR